MLILFMFYEKIMFWLRLFIFYKGTYKLRNLQFIIIININLND